MKWLTFQIEYLHALNYSTGIFAAKETVGDLINIHANQLPLI